MLKKTMTYTDFDENKRTETFYFNLTQAEVTELELSAEGGLTTKIDRIVAAQDNAAIVSLFKEIIGKAYGEKSADGKYFVKNDQVRTAFMQTQAYSDLFIELSTNADAAVAFINGIVPAGSISPSKS